ncbi:ly6/PLAUR domain-containing protein 1-like [Thalassophryne amazonica]|uniref:ly6/PLAUR domain-containing protein 1-like n=1 Tax=Thalassophryne amazonica TaxID=390379 RepID=UPI001471C0C1|nr:ly6/PLAUR domain-containing protein 1-like [Thalassophryne amazonica]
MRLLAALTLFGVFLRAGDSLQIQCYQCEEMKHNDCSTPEYIVNCTINVQNTCQKEVLVKPDEIIHPMWLKQWACDQRILGSNPRQTGKSLRKSLRLAWQHSGIGIHYRKSCASSGACLIASSGYQQFCTGKLNSVCISCCNTPLCNGPKRKRPIPSAAMLSPQMIQPLFFLLTFLLLALGSLEHLTLT